MTEPVTRVAALLAIIQSAGLLGCGLGNASLEAVDPGAAPAQPIYSAHIQPIMERYCTACHAPDAQPGEVAGYGFETCEKVRRNWTQLIETTVEKESMPPGGALRVTEPERLALVRWWRQGGTCD